MARRFLVLALAAGAAFLIRFATGGAPAASPELPPVAAPAPSPAPQRAGTPRPAATNEAPAPASPRPASANALVVRDVSVKHYEREVYFGDVDLAPTLARIERGERRSGGSDDETYQNRERVIPKQPRGYWRKYVHPTPGIGGAGPQRVIVGKSGEVYYTPDHYVTFRKVRGATP